MGDILAGIAPQKDTYANWVILNPTLGKTFNGNDYSQMIFATGSPVGDILIWGMAQSFTTAYTAGQYIIQNSSVSIDDGNLIGSEKKFFTYKDRTAYGYLPYAFDNAVSQTGTYALLYAEVGDIFETQHVAAGDSASGAGMFYPTPIPGAYDRVGIPDSDNIDSTTGVDGYDITLSAHDYNSFQNMKAGSTNGVPIYIKVISGNIPTEIDDETIYYLRFTGVSNKVRLYLTEAGAISASGAISLTDATGTFRLTQEGIVLNDAMQQITGTFGLVDSTGASGGGAFSVGTPGAATGNVDSGATKEIEFNSANSPDARTTNETRPKTNYMFSYIKAFTI